MVSGPTLLTMAISTQIKTSLYLPDLGVLWEYSSKLSCAYQGAADTGWVVEVTETPFVNFSDSANTHPFDDRWNYAIIWQLSRGETNMINSI